MTKPLTYRESKMLDEGDIHEGTRVCRTCHQRKDILEFYFTVSRTSRIRMCRECYNHREKARTAARRATPDGLALVKAKSRRYHLRSEYGLTPDGWYALYDYQNHRCAICKDELTEGAAFVDHEHSSSKIRGLLCVRCNAGIGSFRDDPARLRAAADYLRDWPTNHINIESIPREKTAQELHADRSAAAREAHASAQGIETLRHRRELYSGERAPGAKLSDEQRETILARYALGNISQRELAEEYGVSQTALSHLTRGTISLKRDRLRKRGEAGRFL